MIKEITVHSAPKAVHIVLVFSYKLNTAHT